MSDARFIGLSGFLLTVFGASSLPGIGAFCAVFLGGIMIASAIEVGNNIND